MTVGAIIVVGVVLVVLAVLLIGSVRVVRPDERGVVFRYGRVQPRIWEPGMTMIVPTVDRLVRVPMEPRVTQVPADEMITRDHVSTRVGAAVRVRVIDPVAATVNVEDHMVAIAQLTGATLRSFIGHCDFNELAGTDQKMSADGATGTTIRAQLRELIAEATEGWGLRIEEVEIVLPHPRTEGSSQAPGR